MLTHNLSKVKTEEKSIQDSEIELTKLATPEPIKDWSLTTLKEKLIKIGAKVVSHGRYIAFQMAEVRHPQNSVRRYPAAGLGAAAATGGRIDVKHSIVLRSIKNQGSGASG